MNLFGLLSVYSDATIHHPLVNVSLIHEIEIRLFIALPLTYYDSSYFVLIENIKELFMMILYKCYKRSTV